jgi:hypothetical protein
VGRNRGDGEILSTTSPRVASRYGRWPTSTSRSGTARASPSAWTCSRRRAPGGPLGGVVLRAASPGGAIGRGFLHRFPPARALSAPAVRPSVGPGPVGSVFFCPALPAVSPGPSGAPASAGAFANPSAEGHPPSSALGKHADHSRTASMVVRRPRLGPSCVQEGCTTHCEDREPLKCEPSIVDCDDAIACRGAKEPPPANRSAHSLRE